MRLRQLIESLDSYRSDSLNDFEVKGISCNSKKIKNNFVFVAIKGTHEDGHRFIQEAIKQGARAVVVQIPNPCLSGRQAKSQIPKDISIIVAKDTRKALAKLASEFYGNPSSRIKTIGITGTNGKTTVTYLIEAILKEAGFIPSVIGTVNYRFKGKIIPSENTTPGPIELQSMFKDMKAAGVDYAIMEVSSHALAQDRIEAINFHSAIFTNLAQDHLDYHKTKEDYFQAKAKLFKSLDSDSFTVINNDDRYGIRLKKLTPARVITYGIKKRSDVIAKDIKFDFLHTEFLLESNKKKMKFKTNLIGRHNVYNILAATSWALQEDIDLPTVKSALRNFYLVPGRLQRISLGQDFAVFVDYAHTEDALRNVIDTLRQLTSRKLIVVFGCGGERDKTKRPKMGNLVSELVDFAIITNDNPRSENPKAIIDEIKKGIRKENFCVIPDRKEAIRKSLSMAKSGDIVLVAGKGHEHYQILKDRIIRFDDCEIVKECLKSMNY